MNSKENEVAQALLDEAKNQCRVSPEKALDLIEAYKRLCEAAQTRENKDQ